MDEDNIVARKYLIGACFLCQICLRCKVDQIFLDYECDLERKPAKKQEY
jgi:hypothetical protein